MRIPLIKGIATNDKNAESWNVRFMSEPTILTALRSRSDSDSTEFCARYGRLKELTTLKFERPLARAELEELLSLRESVRRTMSSWLEKR